MDSRRLRWRGTFNATSPRSLGSGSWSGPPALAGRSAGTRERPDQRDRDRIGIGCDTPQSWTPAAKGDQGAVHAQPRSLSQTACTRARCCRRRPAPQPWSTSTIRAARFTYEVQLLAEDAGRRLAQQQTQAVTAVLAWLAGHPPTDPAGSAATDATGTPPAQSTAMPAGTRPPAQPRLAGAAGASTQQATGASGGGSTPEPNRPGPSGGPGGLEGGGSCGRSRKAAG
jgi:hypothetical protein